MKPNYVPPADPRKLSDEELINRVRWSRSLLHIIDDPTLSAKFLPAHGVTERELESMRAYRTWQERWLADAAAVAADRGIDLDSVPLLTLEEFEKINTLGRRPVEFEVPFFEGAKPEELPGLLRGLVDFLMAALETTQQYPVHLDYEKSTTTFTFGSVEDLRGFIALGLARLKKMETRS